MAEEFDYVDVADRVARLLDGDDPVTGRALHEGKAAMTLACVTPTSSRGCASWTASRRSTMADGREFKGYIRRHAEGMDLPAITTRAEADAALAAQCRTTVRNFLLQNLRRDGGLALAGQPRRLGRDLPVLQRLAR